jgi:glucose/arabinose dehydrogenase
MRARLALLAVLAAAFAVAPADAQTPAPEAPEPEKPTQPQQVFTEVLLDDAKTTATIKRLLRSKAAIVDPRSGFVDVTGDGRQDALTLVTTGGAAGTIALYVLSTHGQDAGDQDTSLKALFRLQRLHRATLRISGTTISVLEPKYRAGDDLCCPAKLRQRDYRFSAGRRTFVRVADRTVPFEVR